MLILLPDFSNCIQKLFRFIKKHLTSVIRFKSWVSYHKSDKNDSLPKIKEGVLNPLSHLSSKHSQLTLFNLNMLYAKEYQLQNDLDIVLKNLNRLVSFYSSLITLHTGSFLYLRDINYFGKSKYILWLK